MNGGIFVPGESDEANLSLLLRPGERLGRAARTHEEFRIVVEGDAVHLPQIQVIRLQPIQRLFEHLHRESGVSPMSTDLSHKKDAIAFSFQARAHPVFCLAAMVLPAIVEERDAVIDSLADQAHSSWFVRCRSEMMSAHSEGGNLNASFAEVTEGNRVTAVLGHRVSSRESPKERRCTV